MSSRWRRPASTAGAVAAALRVRRPIVGLVRANYPPWPGGNLAHHPCTDNTLIISDTHENCKGFCAVFFRKIFSFFHFLDPQNPPCARICNLSAYTRCPVCPTLARVCPFCPCHPHFLHFAFSNVLIFLLLRQVLFTLIRVYLFVMSLTCRFFDERSDFHIYRWMFPSPLFRTKKAPGFPPDACLIWLLHLSIMGYADNVRPLRTGRNPSILPPSVPHDSAHTSHCCC